MPTQEEVYEASLEAERAPEPGSFSPASIIHSADSDIPTALVATALDSAGWIYVYDTANGDRSVINRNMLPVQLRKRHTDGSRAFTTRKPAFEPKRGTIKCLLHTDNPRRSGFDDLGFPVCPKSNLMSPFQLQRHMKARHPTEWATLQEETQRLQVEEERAYRKSIADLIQQKAKA